MGGAGYVRYIRCVYGRCTHSVPKIEFALAMNEIEWTGKGECIEIVNIKMSEMLYFCTQYLFYVICPSQKTRPALRTDCGHRRPVAVGRLARRVC